MTHDTSTDTYQTGDAVVFDGRPSEVIATSDRPGILTVRNYAGQWMIHASHSGLARVRDEHGAVIPRGAVVAVGRFEASGPTGYRAASNPAGTLYPTRAEAIHALAAELHAAAVTR